MNPLIKKTAEKILGTEVKEKDMPLVITLADAIEEAVLSAQQNPSINLCGGDSVDENTLGIFVPERKGIDFAKIFQEVKTLKWSDFKTCVEGKLNRVPNK